MTPLDYITPIQYILVMTPIILIIAAWVAAHRR